MYFRSLITVLALAFLLGACQLSAEPQAGSDAAEKSAPGFTETDEASIRRLLENYAASTRKEDWQSIARHYASDAVRMPPNEPMLQGQGAIMTALKETPPVSEFTLTPQAIDGDGDLAYARGKYSMAVDPPDAEQVKSAGKWLAVYQRQADGSWLAVSDIWNSDEPTSERKSEPTSKEQNAPAEER